MEMTTIKQVADDLGISKQRVANYVRKHMKDVHRTTSQGGEAVCLNDEQVRQVKAHFIDMAERGDKRMQPRVEPVNDVPQNPLEDPAVRAVIAQYEARISDMQTEIERLHAALEREQSSHVGFWSRIGRKLLGDGTRD